VHPRHRSRTAVFLLALVVSAGAAHSQTGPAPAAPVAVWEATYDWSLEVEGVLSLDALFFRERTSDRLLILPVGSAEVALLDQTGKTITPLRRDQIRVSADGETADLDPRAVERRPVSSQYTLDAQRGAVLFYLGSKRMKILMRAPLQGPTTQEEIFKHSPVYRKGMEAYRPEPGPVQSIKGHRGAVKIEVYFGTWCPHCKIVVPQFMKSIAEAASRELSVEYIGVPRRFDQWPPSRSKGVRGLPTLIFYRDGMEFGRIPGGAEDGPIERMVAQILNTSSG
jgi:thiol-disulfide isomerase/thioredoxin